MFTKGCLWEVCLGAFCVAWRHEWLGCVGSKDRKLAVALSAKGAIIPMLHMQPKAQY